MPRKFSSLLLLPLLVAACGGDGATPSKNAATPNPSDLTVSDGGGDGTLPVIEVAYSKFKQVKKLDWHTDSVSSVAFSPDGRLFATGAWGYVALWNTATWERINEFEPQYRIVQVLEFSRDGKLLLTAGSDGTAKVWSTDKLDEPLVAMGDYETYWVQDANLSPDKSMVAICSSELIHLRRVSDGEQVWEVKNGKEITVNSIAFSPNGKHLASAIAGAGHPIRIWDVATGDKIGELSGHKKDVLWVEYSPDGKRIASCSSDMTARIWNVDSGTTLHELSGHGNVIHQVAFSPDSRYLATAGYDQMVRIWSVENGTEVCALKGHGDKVLSIAFSTDGQFLASGSVDETAIVWGIPSAPTDEDTAD